MTLARTAPFAAALLLTAAALAKDPAPWSVDTFPDEPGYQKRIENALKAHALRPLGDRLRSHQKCPKCNTAKTGWHIPGDVITCAKCGEYFEQDGKSYFGPHTRDDKRRITSFRGDALKFEMPTIIARLMLDPNDKEVLELLRIPGVQKQQYHFACVQWVRLYGLMGDKLPPDIRDGLKAHVAHYQETFKPSDADGNSKPAGNSHNLVGLPGHLLGGPVINGGTENHKTMWRTSGLLYAQYFPDSTVSSLPAKDAEAQITKMLADYLDTSLRIGNGEYNSTSYYPWSVRGYMNLFDFSPRQETRQLAQATLDFYFATYGLHMMAYTYTGSQKRGWPAFPPHQDSLDQMCRYWLDPKARQTAENWLGRAGAAQPGGDPDRAHRILPATPHQVTTKYRPNRIRANIITKNVPLPFEARLTHPDYHMKSGNAFQEYLYVDKDFALGSGQQTMVDNPTQQTIWSLTVRGEHDVPLVFGGGHPRFRSPEGHSPYTQVMQHKNTLILMTANTQSVAGELSPEGMQRAGNAADKLSVRTGPRGAPAEWVQWWNESPKAAESWLFIPRAATLEKIDDTLYIIDAHAAFVALRARTATTYILSDLPPVEESVGKAFDPIAKALKDSRILVNTGDVSGYTLEVVAKTRYPARDALVAALKKQSGPGPARRDAQTLRTVDYKTLDNDALTMAYDSTALRPAATINGQQLNYATWANGAVVDSPYVKIKDGVMTLTDGRDSYSVRIQGTRAVFDGK